MLVFLCLLSFCDAAGFYSVTTFYSDDLTCAGSITGYLSKPVASCTAVTSCINVNNFYGQKVACVSDSNSITSTVPSTWATFQTWDVSTTCSGNPSGLSAFPADTCSGKWQSSTVELVCDNASPNIGSLLDCNGTKSTCDVGCTARNFNKINLCTAGNPTTTFTMQSYKGYCPPTTTAASTITTLTTSSGNQVTTTESPTTSSAVIITVMFAATLAVLSLSF